MFTIVHHEFDDREKRRGAISQLVKGKNDLLSNYKNDILT